MSFQHPEYIRLDLPAAFIYLHILSDCIADMLSLVKDVSNSEAQLYNIQLAAHEVCTNIVSHAYAGNPAGRIAISLTLLPFPPQLIVELSDTGRAFDLASVPEPDLEEAQIHGYGLFLIRNLMDSVTYTSQTNGNIWRLVKDLEGK